MPIWGQVSGLSEIEKARFWIKAEHSGYCWEWKASKNIGGYGVYKIGRKMIIASRVAYQIVHGKIGENIHVLHKCDNPGCVNPDHLFAGTHQDNMDDMVKKGKRKSAIATSRYRGVSFRKDSNSWRALIWKNKKMISLGSFDNEIDAAKRRDEEVIKRKYGTPLNFPLPNPPKQEP